MDETHAVADLVEGPQAPTLFSGQTKDCRAEKKIVFKSGPLTYLKVWIRTETREYLLATGSQPTHLNEWYEGKMNQRYLKSNMYIKNM